jgi:hypothetical protein
VLVEGAMFAFHAAGIASIDLFVGAYNLFQAALRPGHSSSRPKGQISGTVDSNSSCSIKEALT